VWIFQLEEVRLLGTNHRKRYPTLSRAVGGLATVLSVELTPLECETTTLMSQLEVRLPRVLTTQVLQPHCTLQRQMR
jgi:hypothetical protein